MSEQDHTADLEVELVEAETVTGGMQPPNPGAGDEIHEVVERVESLGGERANRANGAPVRAPHRAN